ncbi:MAG: hypothetical protein DCC57_19495 [Chloroflexi bacterium]|nr:MAG: hypothetical protein DCC57_19495 [Chloroflexota bacterium]
MSDQYVDAAKERMGAIERLLKGLPGIRGYVDKELRRDADKRLREMIAGELEEVKQSLYQVQRRLLEGKGLLWMDNIDNAIQKLQILIDRIKTASYGYAGLFDPVRIGAEELNALHRFDAALAERVVDLRMAVTALGSAVGNEDEMGTAVHKLTDLLADLNTLYNKRHEAVLSPDLLKDPGYGPEVEPGLQNPEA